MPSQVNNELYQNCGLLKKPLTIKKKNQILVDQSVLVIKTQNTILSRKSAYNGLPRGYSDS